MTLRKKLALLRPVKPRGAFYSLAWAWPTGERDLLLRAAILDDLSRAALDYQSWQTRYDFDEVDFSKMRLLVAIANRIPYEHLNADDRGRLNGIERMLWTISRMAMRAAEPAFATLAAARIDVMVFKGAGRAVGGMANLRGRYASDVDLLVHPSDFVRAVESLVASGWDYANGAPRRVDELIGLNLKRGPHGKIDIHQYPYHQMAPVDGLSDALWARASRHIFDGHPVFLPSATDRLIIAVAHGGIEGHAHSDWLIDAAQIIRDEEVDWRLFEGLCFEQRVEALAAIGLSYLAGPLEVPVSHDLLWRLEAGAKRQPFKFATTLLEARPKRDHNTALALTRTLAKASRMIGRGIQLWRLRRLAKRARPR
jgi:hypothetical protein